MRPLFLLTFLAGLTCMLHAQQKGYYRTPALHANTVIFTAEGDLWKYDISGGGVASRLTTHQGMETNPVISPDGSKIIFSGQYEGATELYEIPIEGGVPRRLTYEFDGARPACWAKDGRVLYRTSKFSCLPNTSLALLDPASLAVEAVPLAQGSDACYGENGVLYFTRLPNQGSKTKRYKGGFIEQVWKFDGRREAVCLTGDFTGTSTRPMYYKGRVYFLSDRDGTMNLWSMDENGKDVKQHTFSKGWDLQSPSLSGGRVVYQKGADLWLYDIGAGSEKELDIRLLSDFDQRKPRWIKNPISSITYADISPSGNYAVLISRGRLFVTPAKSDRWVEVNRRSGIRYREAHFINEKELVASSDESGEFELWRVSADGSAPARPITRNTKPMITAFTVSPDGKYIACTNKNDELRILETSTGAERYKFDNAYDGLAYVGWSNDSRFMNFVQTLPNEADQLCVVDVSTMKMAPVTTDRLNSFDPSWCDSSWLFFLSERSLHTRVGSPWGSRQPEPYYTETRKIYAMPLDTGARFPFLATDSWMTDSLYNPGAKTVSHKHGGVSRAYDWSRLQKELYEVPVKNANLANLSAVNGWLYWMDYGVPGSGESGAKLYALQIKEAKKYEPVEVASGVVSYRVSRNRKKLLVRFANRTLAIADVNGQKIDVEKTKLVLENWNFVVDPAEDWKEMFADAWRMMRDYFYDRDLHKVDWAGVRKQYEPLVERLTDRYELDDLLAQMVGELSALHTFVAGGDKRVSPDQIPVGFLGARLLREGKGERIEHIYRSDPDYPESVSPLERAGLRIHDGDVITAVDNIGLDQVPDIAVLLANKVGVPVKLSLVSRDGHAYEEVVRPESAGDEFGLRYGEWELSRREMADSMSHNDIGYVHLRAMGSEDMDAFVKQFYPVFNRKGLIIDVRHNNGGNIDSWVLEKLIRKSWMYWQGRAGGPTWNMPFAFRGHMVILCDQETASDGEAVTEGFRRLGLGKVIGMRTWGGEIWLSADNRLVDNGIATAAETGVYGPEGKWLIEGHGVDPDIVVDNLPWETYKGKDAQLEAAIDYLRKQIAAEPTPVTPAPQHPDKSFRY
jgi:tricorn protease